MVSALSAVRMTSVAAATLRFAELAKVPPESVSDPLPSGVPDPPMVILPPPLIVVPPLNVLAAVPNAKVPVPLLVKATAPLPSLIVAPLAITEPPVIVIVFVPAVPALIAPDSTNELTDALLTSSELFKTIGAEIVSPWLPDVWLSCAFALFAVLSKIKFAPTLAEMV